MSELQAGPELDAMVADKVLGLVPCAGWEPINLGSGGGPAVMKRCAHPDDACYSTVVYGGGGCPRYSTEIRYAWAVVERVQAMGIAELYVCFDKDGYWEVELLPKAGVEGIRGTVAQADTAPLAICRAALGVPA